MAESFKGLHRTKRCAEFTKDDVGKIVTITGWVQKIRNKGSLCFIDLRDRTGIIQIVLDDTTCTSELIQKAQKCKQEYVLAVVGEVNLRKGEINEKIPTGTIEVIPSELRILCESEVLPFQLDQNAIVREELRLEYRFLDLRRQDLQKNLMIRSKASILTRKFLADEGFLEIETPTLCKSTPEGARDYLVPSRVKPGTFYALPQSPQLYKQLLMVSGMDRYFQLARCYRDEDLRADRQPEFTQIDMEMSFVDIDDVIDVNERLIKFLFKEICNEEVKLPIQRMKWIDAMENYGVDKPDTRFDMKLIDVTKECSGIEFNVFKNVLNMNNEDNKGYNKGCIKGLNVKNASTMPRKKIDSIIEYAKEYGLKGLCYMAIEEDGNIKSSFTKFLKDEEIELLKKKMNAQNGDLLLFAADKKKIVWQALGALRLFLAHDLNLIDENKFNFLWVTEFPLLEWNEEENRYVAMHHPFTNVMDEDLDIFFSNDPGLSRAKAYDIVLNGTEIGGGSIRIHDPKIQERMFDVIGIPKDVASRQFGYLLKAFKYGVPPHGGIAYGLDRVVMLMLHAKSIRDVIAFPKNKDATCLMVNTPDIVEEKQLEELCIKIVENKKD
ncbi:MAG: aspartate--tRNA ligase [Eubacteriales bacterium]|nr:aspartate--tRNA ligase [Eubacteriales bacterium]